MYILCWHILYLKLHFWLIWTVKRHYSKISDPSLYHLGSLLELSSIISGAGPGCYCRFPTQSFPPDAVNAKSTDDYKRLHASHSNHLSSLNCSRVSGWWWGPCYWMILYVILWLCLWPLQCRMACCASGLTSASKNEHPSFSPQVRHRRGNRPRVDTLSGARDNNVHHTH